jgi:CheY-like chemotaxis protein
MTGGRISIEASTSEGFVDVRVSDTGRGIDREFLPHVFERFRQGDSSATRAAGGLGLGLFISRRLVEAHGGRVGVESDGVGRGATFTVSLPVHQETAVPASPSPAASEGDARQHWPSLTGVHVLLVDDEADAREAMAAILETSGASVLTARSGDEAMEILSRDAIHVDVILSDIAMPDTDGYTLIRRIRSETPSRVAALPAAAVTACAGAEDRRRALSAGFQEHLVKPVTPETLVSAVAYLATDVHGA